MTEYIQLLPDHLANQIAAGEVIQRPASVVKELLENAIDAGATNIQLIVKDAGKELIQVVDNGKGMSPVDARMCFERHATSKIKSIDDLFTVRTMGFRGEALPSIAAVAQVELKTKTEEEAAATHIVIEASQITKQELVAHPKGTNVAVKNLFFNLPARRKFLKSNVTETKNILEEFTRIAIAYPQISFRFFNNNTEQFHLSATTLKHRIVELLGKRFETQLIPIKEMSDFINIYGFVGKPESVAKTRGNQFFFINNRFFRNQYLNHAVTNAYEGLILKEEYPFYIIFLETNPKTVDVNVHPSKQEVKFEEERIVYAFISANVKQALAKYNVAPSIDFTLNPEIQNLDAISKRASEKDKNQAGNGYLQHSFSKHGRAHLIESSRDRAEWKKQKNNFMPDIPKMIQDIPSQIITPSQEQLFEADWNTKQPVIQWRNILVSTMKSGLLMVNHKKALERIYFEKLLRRAEAQQAVSQQLLFPITFQMSPMDAVLLQSLLEELKHTGYNVSDLGNNTFCINGAPVDIQDGEEEKLLEEVLEHIKNESSSIKNYGREKLLRTMAKKMAKPQILSTQESQALIDELFACAQPQYTPDGEKIFVLLTEEQLEAAF